MDGHFSPDGASVAVSDSGGQLHLYGLGAPSALMARAPYDQFLTTDFNQLMWDAHRHVLDMDTQQPAHILTGTRAALRGGVHAPLATRARALAHLRSGDLRATPPPPPPTPRSPPPRAGREGVCDTMGHAYPQPFQAAYFAQHVLSAPARVRDAAALGES